MRYIRKILPIHHLFCIQKFNRKIKMKIYIGFYIGLTKFNLSTQKIGRFDPK